MTELAAVTADQVNEAHRLARSSAENAVQFAIRCGELLVAKKRGLKHGEFQGWVEANCKFGYRRAAAYLALARKAKSDPGITFASIRKALAYEAPSAPQHQRSPESLPANGMTLADLEAMSGRGYGCITADPPWQYGNQGTRASQGNHYGGMSVDDMCALPVSRLAADQSHLHLWTTNAFLFEAKRLIEAWGFTYKSCFVWVKPQMGIGNYWRVSHEFLLLGVRGSVPFVDKSLMSWLEEPRGKHSAKPERVYDLIQRASPGPYLEMFARRRSRPGWSFWGNEIEREIFAA
jgi:N6-adenosine-specific RNA methylase IME4